MLTTATVLVSAANAAATFVVRCSRRNRDCSHFWVLSVATVAVLNRYLHRSREGLLPLDSDNQLSLPYF
jgi:hypothetical protein